MRTPRRPGFHSFIIVFCVIQYAILLVACHRNARPWDPDPALPSAFRTPQQAFLTWRQASLQADRATLQSCYWPGLSRAEMAAYLTENLRPEALRLFVSASWQGMRPRSPVEINFSFRSKDGQTYNGVMVRTAAGWKIQHW